MSTKYLAIVGFILSLVVCGLCSGCGGPRLGEANALQQELDSARSPEDEAKVFEDIWASRWGGYVSDKPKVDRCTYGVVFPDRDKGRAVSGSRLKIVLRCGDMEEGALEHQLIDPDNLSRLMRE